MKTSFFSWSAVGMVLAAWCFLSCSSKEGVFVGDPNQDSSLFRIIDKSKQNLLGKKVGLINPCDVKITSADNFPVINNCGQSPVIGGTYGEGSKLFGDGSYIGLDNQQKLMQQVLDKHQGRYDFVYYIDLPGGDRDTLVFKRGEINTDTNKPSIYYNGEKAIIFNNIAGSEGYTYLIKNNN